MGDIFELGFGPFRWICTSTLDEDLRRTDKIAEETIESLMKDCPEQLHAQYSDNLSWIRQA
jgi:urocanate hydratase